MLAMNDTGSPDLGLHVPPDEMVKYIQDLMRLPHSEIAADTALTMIADERADFDITALLDATLEFQPPVGQA